MKSYMQCLQDHLEPWILKDSQVHRSLEFLSNPGDFVCELSETVSYFFNLGFSGTDDGRRADEVKLDKCGEVTSFRCHGLPVRFVESSPSLNDSAVSVLREP